MENENIRLSEYVALHQDIKRQSKFFGIISNLVYVPTGSRLKFQTKNYLPKYGEQLKELFTQTEPAIIGQSARGTRFEEAMNGHFELEMCCSADKQFVAIRLLQYVSLQYNPITDIRIFTGEAAEAVCRMI